MLDFKGFLDATKSFVYELLAVLVPGALLVAAAKSSLPIELPNDWVAIAISWVTGLSLQGLTHFLQDSWKSSDSDWRKLHDLHETTRGQSEPAPEERVALMLARRRANFDLPRAMLLDFCLSRLDEPRRNLYDKFVGLRDAARGLMAAIPLSAVLLLYRWHTGWSIVLVLGAGALAYVGLRDRYVMFAPLARKVVFGQYVSLESEGAPPGGAFAATPAPAASAPNAATGKIFPARI